MIVSCLSFDNFEVSANDPTNSTENKTYFIKNFYSGDYLSNTSNGFSLSAYSGADDQKWQVEHLNDGSVRLVSLRDFAYWYGDRNVVYAFSSSYLGIAVGSSMLEMDSGQCWYLDGSLQCCSIYSKAFTSYKLATSNSLPCLSSTSDWTSFWVLIECSNSYVLPGTIDGVYSVEKYNSTGPDGLRYKMNCYAYAVGYYGEYYLNSTNLLDGSIYQEVQPGYMSDNMVDYSSLIPYLVWDSSSHQYVLSDDGVDFYANTIIDALDTDLQYLFSESSSSNRIFPSSATEVMSGPWKKVALVISSSAKDYHWFLQNDDGYWSHKPGTTAVTQEDFGLPKTIITNLNSCDLGIYDYFIGYYKIRVDSVLKPVLSPFSANNDIYDYEFDKAGDVSSMARNLGIISPGVHHWSTDFNCSIEYSSFSNNFDCTDLCNGKIVTNTFMWDADADWFEFSVSESGIYTIYSGSCDGDLYGSIYSPEGVLIEEDDDTGSDYNFYLSVSLTEGVLYRLCVSSYLDNCDTSTYIISFY